MIQIDLSLCAQAERYLLSHSCTTGNARLLRSRTRDLTDFAGGNLSIKELTCDLGNRWLKHLLDRGKMPRTVNSYRASIYCVWNDAYLDGLCDEAPLRFRKVKEPGLLVFAYRVEEIRALIQGAKRMQGSYPNGVSRAGFWVAAIMVGYDSGMRNGDLLTFRLTQIAPEGRFGIVQNKTGHDHYGGLRPETLAALDAIPHPDDLVLPWCHNRKVFGEHFKKVRALAKIERGTFKWVRRSAGSYAEKEQRGNGSRVLGHRDSRVFARFYEDRSITHENPVSPPPL